jgi:hypothetical protein
MLHEFVGTPYEDDEGIREESRGHRALLLVPALSRKQRCGHEERPLHRRATRRTKLGTPPMGFETPDATSAALSPRGLHSNGDRTIPTVKPRSGRRHLPSLRRCSREDLAPLSKKGMFGAEPEGFRTIPATALRPSRSILGNGSALEKAPPWAAPVAPATKSPSGRSCEALLCRRFSLCLIRPSPRNPRVGD